MLLSGNTMQVMRLSLKISLATLLAISVVLVASGYYSVHREMALLQTDVLNDHRTLGRAIALATSAAAERTDPASAKAILAEMNARESHVDLRWVADAHAPPDGSPMSTNI